MRDINVVVIGGLHHNTLGVVRSLGEVGIKNIKVLVVGKSIPEKNIISLSKYVNVSDVSSVDFDSQIPEYLKILSRDKMKRVIICCSDGSAMTTISRCKELKDSYWMPSTKVPVDILMSKEEQSKIAVECGLKVPYGMLIETSKEISWNKFPCITKPIRSVEGAGKADIHISHSKEELEIAIKETNADHVQLQEYVKKSMEYQLIGCSLNAGETIIIPGYTDIIRQPENTNTGYLKYSPIKDFYYDKQAVQNFIRRIGYSGLFSVEFIRVGEKNDYFLEINLRNDGNAYCVKTAGVNLPYIWCYYQVYGKIPDVSRSFSEPIWFMPDFNDIKIGIKSVGIFTWIKQFFQAKSHSIYNTRDMKPFIFQFRKRITRR